MHRTATVGTELADNLAQSFARTRDRGCDVDLTTPALAQAARVLGALQRDGMPAHVSRIMDQLLVEIMVGFTEDQVDSGTSVATVAAPVFDHHGRVALILGVHPFRTQTATQVADIGDRADPGNR